jgi:hypothetical protein
MLLVDKSEKFSVNLLYRKAQRGDIEILSKEPEDGVCEKATFDFRRPSWGDIRTIMMHSTVGRSLSDIDPMAFLEAKIKTLLVSWSLTDDAGKELPHENLDRFPPQAVMYLNSELDKLIGTEGLLGVKIPTV